MGRGLVAAGVAASVVAGVAVASAEPTAEPGADALSEPSLVFEAAAGCPARDAFVQAVRARTEAAFPDRTSVTIVAQEGTFDGWLAVGDRAPRRITMPDCSELIDALALSLALQLERREHEATPMLDVPPSVPVSIAGPHAPPSGDQGSADPAPRDDTRLGWRVEGGADLRAAFGRGVRARPEPSVGAGLRLRAGRWAGSARLSFFRSGSGELVEAGEGRAGFTLTGGRLLVCPAGYDLDTVFVDGCGELEIASLDAEGELVTGANATETWIAAGGLARLGVRFLPNMGLAMTGGLSAPLVPYRFSFADPFVALYETPAVGGHVGGGLFFQLP